MAGRVAVADTDDFTGALHGEVDEVVGPWAPVGPVRRRPETVMTLTSRPSALMVDRSGISWIATAGPVVCTSSAATFSPALYAVAVSVPRRVVDRPLQLFVPLHRLTAERFSIQRQFHFVTIAVAANVDRLAFLTGPIPVGQHVHHRLFGPARLIVVKRILGEPAGVENAELAADGGPAERRGFAAVIETRPGRMRRRRTAGRRRSSSSARRWTPSWARCRRRRLTCVRASSRAYAPRVVVVLPSSVPMQGWSGCLAW